MLSELDLLSAAVTVGATVIYGYVAYSAYAISRTLSNRVYRRQALGMAFVTAIILISGEATGGYNGASGPISTVDFIVGFSSFYLLFVGIYYWIDASIAAARLTDPLYRDTFHWTRLRVAFWAYDGIAYVFFLIAGTLGIFAFSASPPIVEFFIVVPLLIMLFSGAVVLPLAARRSKDRVMKRHLNWFAVYVIVVFGFIFATPLNLTALEIFAAEAAGGYLLYLSVRSLVPLYRFKDASKGVDKVPEKAPEV